MTRAGPTIDVDKQLSKQVSEFAIGPFPQRCYMHSVCLIFMSGKERYVKTKR